MEGDGGTPPKPREKRLESSCSLKAMHTIIHELSEDQRAVVKTLGFGGLLSLECSKYCPQLIRWLVEKYDIHTCMFKFNNGVFSVTDRDVELILGLSTRGESVEPLKSRTSVQALRDKYELTKRTTVLHVNRFLPVIREGRCDDKFRQAFTLWVLGIFLCPISNGRTRDFYLHHVIDPSGIHRFAWGHHVLDIMNKALKSYIKKSKQTVGCCVALLQVWFFAHAAHEIMSPAGTQVALPLIKFWDDEQTSEMDEKLRSIGYENAQVNAEIVLNVTDAQLHQLVDSTMPRRDVFKGKAPVVDEGSYPLEGKDHKQCETVDAVHFQSIGESTGDERPSCPSLGRHTIHQPSGTTADAKGTKRTLFINEGVKNEAPSKEDEYLDYDWPTLYEEARTWEKTGSFDAKTTTPEASCKVELETDMKRLSAKVDELSSIVMKTQASADVADLGGDTTRTAIKTLKELFERMDRSWAALMMLYPGRSRQDDSIGAEQTVIQGSRTKDTPCAPSSVLSGVGEPSTSIPKENKEQLRSMSDAKDATCAAHLKAPEVIMVEEDNKSPGIAEPERSQLQPLGRGHRAKKKSGQVTSPYTSIGGRKRSRITEDPNGVGNQLVTKETDCSAPWIRNLTDTENRLVNFAFDLGEEDSESVFSMGAFNVSHSTFRSLAPSQKVSTHVFDAYTSLLMRQQAEKRASLPGRYYMDFRFARYMLREDDVPIGILKDEVNTLHLPTANWVLIPICHEDHWIAYAVDMKRKCIYYMDSLKLSSGERDAFVAPRLVSALTGLFTSIGHTEDFSLYERASTVDLPLQANSFDCGVFCMCNVSYFNGPGTLRYTQADIDSTRRVISARMLDSPHNKVRNQVMQMAYRNNRRRSSRINS